MFCISCGKQLPDPRPAFCPHCGATQSPPPAQPAPAQPAPAQPAPAQPPGQAAPESPKFDLAGVQQRAGQHAQNIAAHAERFASGSEILGKVPGRSLTLVSLGLLASAIALGFIGDLAGLGLIWAAVMFVGIALVAVQELTRAGWQGAKLPALPRLAMHPLSPIVFTTIVIGHAIRLWDISITGIMWALAAVALSYEQYRRARVVFAGNFDLKHAFTKPRILVSAVALLAIATIFMNFTDTPTYFVGGYEYQYGYDSGSNSYGYGYEYNPLSYTQFGYDFPGRTIRFSELVLGGLVLIILWAAFARPPIDPKLWRYLPLGLCAAMVVWWVFSGVRLRAAWVFLALVVALAALVFQEQRREATQAR